MSAEGGKRWKGHIDGLRAISVLAVLFYHAGIAGVPGGFVGVDIFFVISGFLISRIIYDDIETHGRFTAARFYERRVRRILPVFFVVTAATLCFGYFVLLPDAYASLAESALYASGFAGNVFFFLNSTYFGQDAGTMPLLHYWSLGVEEQFYIVFPLVVWAIGRFRPRLLPAAVIVMAIASFIIAEMGVRAGSPAPFYLAHYRAWELLMGGILALPRFPFPRHRLVQDIAAAAGVALILFAVVTFTRETPFPGLAAAAPVFGAVLVLWGCERGSTTAGRLLTRAPLRQIGLWSYSIYMIHWPLLVYAREVWPSDTGLFGGILVVASIGLGWLSYRFVETPFRWPSKTQGRGLVFSGAFISLVAMAAGAASIYLNDGWRGRLPSNVRAVLAYNTYDRRSSYRERQCFLDPDQSWADLDQDTCLETGVRTVLLWGDSHAAHYFSALNTWLAKKGVTLAQANKSGCSPVFRSKLHTPSCIEFNEMVFDWIAAHKPELVIMSGMWPQHPQWIKDELDPTLERIAALGQDFSLIGESPQYKGAVPTILARRLLHGDTNRFAVDEVTQLDVVQNRWVRDGSNVIGQGSYIFPRDTLCDPLCPMMTEDGVPMYWDETHLTAVGAEIAVQRMSHALDQIIH